MNQDILQQSTPVSERKCRVCGCTDGNCARCIKLTGKPCHWVEDDLCSACQIVAPTESKDVKEDKGGDDQHVSIELPIITTPTNFFTTFFPIIDGIDITLKFKRSAGLISVEVLPVTASIVKPMKIAGTPEELNEKFFEVISKPVEMAKGLTVDLDEYKASLPKPPAEQKPADPAQQAPKEEKNKHSKKEAGKKVVKQRPVVPDMFA